MATAARFVVFTSVANVVVGVYSPWKYCYKETVKWRFVHSGDDLTCQLQSYDILFIQNFRKRKI